MMIVNDLRLPASFEAFLKNHPKRVWELKKHVDAYGLPLVDTYGRPLRVQFEPYDTLEEIKKNTAVVVRSFGRMVDLSRFDPERRERVRADLEAERPSNLPTITDYSQIVQFGCSPGMPPFCFDFRENLQEPSVIHMPMGQLRWRRMAPNFETFICLFAGYEEE